MNRLMNAGSDTGFTLIEVLIAIVVMIPIMGAAVSLFNVGTNQYASEQSSISANQEARAALEMMTAEIAQAGSHSDRATVTTGSVSASASDQAVAVASSEGIEVGDWVEIDTDNQLEAVKVTAVTSRSISGIFLLNHASGVPLRLFALPFPTGIIPPPGTWPDTSVPVTTLRFFGVMNHDVLNNTSVLEYVEYVYDSANAQITRSATPITQTIKNPALPFVRNVKPASVQFLLNTDNMGVVTSVHVSMTVMSSWKTVSDYEETTLSTSVSIPSIRAASVLLSETLGFGGVNKLPPTPAQVTAWVNQ
jgi:type II secretory pathway pseudopilin PulG